MAARHDAADTDFRLQIKEAESKPEHASAFRADTINIIQKEKRHPSRDWDTHPPTIGPITMPSERSAGYYIVYEDKQQTYRAPSMAPSHRETMRIRALSRSTYRSMHRRH